MLFVVLFSLSSSLLLRKVLLLLLFFAVVAMMGVQDDCSYVKGGSMKMADDFFGLGSSSNPQNKTDVCVSANVH
jgi:hypothetical protein